MELQPGKEAVIKCPKDLPEIQDRIILILLFIYFIINYYFNFNNNCSKIILTGNSNWGSGPSSQSNQGGQPNGWGAPSGPPPTNSSWGQSQPNSGNWGAPSGQSPPQPQPSGGWGGGEPNPSQGNAGWGQPPPQQNKSWNDQANPSWSNPGEFYFEQKIIILQL